MDNQHCSASIPEECTCSADWSNKNFQFYLHRVANAQNNIQLKHIVEELDDHHNSYPFMDPEDWPILSAAVAKRKYP